MRETKQLVSCIIIHSAPCYSSKTLICILLNTILLKNSAADKKQQVAIDRHLLKHLIKRLFNNWIHFRLAIINFIASLRVSKLVTEII